MRWTVRFAVPALADFGHIIEWTAREFGPGHATRYESAMAEAAQRLHQGPFVLHTQASLGSDRIRFMPVLDGRRRARHVLYFSWYSQGDEGRIQILRILHAAMDPTLHLPPES